VAVASWAREGGTWFVFWPLVVNFVGFFAVAVWFKVKDWREARNRKKWGE